MRLDLDSGKERPTGDWMVSICIDHQSVRQLVKALVIAIASGGIAWSGDGGICIYRYIQRLCVSRVYDHQICPFSGSQKGRLPSGRFLEPLNTVSRTILMVPIVWNK
jgi:hypothetical protein